MKKNKSLGFRLSEEAKALMILAVFVVGGGLFAASEYFYFKTWQGLERSPLARNLQAAVVSEPGTITIEANSCSQIDVQAAIDSAEDGNIVLVPAGECTWTISVIIYEKEITLQGAGIGETIINDSVSGSNGALDIIGVNGKPFRVTGFTFDGSENNHHTLGIYGDSKNFRVDHSRFQNFGGRGVWIEGYTFGVIDHCDFEWGHSQAIYTELMHESDSVGGTFSWTELPLGLGTANAIYVEDSTFKSNEPEETGFATILDGAAGYRLVFRNNDVTNGYIMTHGRDIKNNRGVYSLEIYNNTFLADGKNHWRLMFIRGGTGVVWGNTVTEANGGYVSNFAHLTNYCSCCQFICPDLGGGCSGIDPCNSAGCGFDLCTSYPCIDQVGRATNQELAPFYEWDNTFVGGDGDLVVWEMCDTIGDHIQDVPHDGELLADYYNDTPMPGYVPYTYPHPLTDEGETEPGCDDLDGDGYSVEGGDCGTVDCDDSDVAIYPGAEEICDDAADNDCDGNVDADDVDCMVVSPEVDVNMDGKVNIYDLVKVALNYGQADFDEAADVDYDGQVGLVDLQLVAQNLDL